MAFTTPLTAQSAGRAAPLSYLIGGIVVTLVALSFVVFSRRIAHAGSVYAYVGLVFGSQCGFVAGWALLLMYVTLLDGSTALVRSFTAAGLDHAGVEWPNLWLFVAVLAALFSVWLTCRYAARRAADVGIGGRLHIGDHAPGHCHSDAGSSLALTLQA
jgi:amino acid transporter